jgi:hypothetical protein
LSKKARGSIQQKKKSNRIRENHEHEIEELAEGQIALENRIDDLQKQIEDLAQVVISSRNHAEQSTFDDSNRSDIS